MRIPAALMSFFPFFSPMLIVTMALEIILLFFTDVSLTQHSNPISYRFREKGSGREGASEPAILTNLDYRNTFCRRQVNVVFPHPHAYNIFYRCRRNRRETWQCTGNFYFDWKRQICVPLLFPQAINEVCSQQEEGLFPVHQTNCKSYVRCKEGVTIEEKECGSNELFSYHLQSCRKSGQVSCIESVCAPNSDGFYILPGSNCAAYYLCRKGVSVKFLCPNGQAFNLEKKMCVDGGICYEPICVGRIDGVYPDTTHKCNRYFTCKSGKLIRVTTCPESFKHNGFMCLPGEGVECERPEKTAVVIYNRMNDKCRYLRDGIHIMSGTNCEKIRFCENGRTTGIAQCPTNYRFNGRECYLKELTICDDSCSERPDGYYPDESEDCREYFHCYDKTVTERKKCETGNSFDGKLCLPSIMVNCRKEKEIERCEGLRDGFHPDYLNRCRNYFYCRDEQTIFESACPEGTKWDGLQCTNDFICENPKRLNQCHGAITGLHRDRDISSNCTRYIYCRQGLGISLSCPKHQLYDGFRCRSSNEYACQNDAHNECFNQSDGYRQDKKSNCRSYFFCSNGTKITYVCPSDTIYNGTNCVSTDAYNCPFNSNDCAGKHDGYYPDETGSCKQYYYCYRGTRVGTFTCGGKKIFNGESCILVSNAKSACQKATSDLGKRSRSGPYPNTWETSVECRGQQLMRESSQPLQKVYAGGAGSSNCLSVPSKMESSFSCDSQTPAFAADYNSGCRKYYYCLGNLKMMATCPNGTIFNGRVCQSDKTYSCPKKIFL